MWFRRLRTRLTVLYAGAFGIALLLIAAAVQLAITQNVERMVRSELVTSGTVFDRLWALRSQRLRDAADLLARDFGFRAAVATHDSATIVSAVDNLKARLGLQVAFIIDDDGRVVGLAGSRAQADAQALWRDLDAGWTAGVVRLDGKTYQMVAAPVMAPTLIGWVIFARELDRHEMNALTRLSAIPLRAAVVRRDPDSAWRHDGTGAAVSGAEIHALLDRTRRTPAAAAADVAVAADGDVVLAKPLRTASGGTPVALLLRYPMAEALADYRPLEIAVGVAGLVGLALMCLASWRLSLTITRPISALEQAARRLERGERIEVEVETEDEVGVLARSFNAMAAGIEERERRIAHMAFHDALTGLPNRMLFREQLELLLRRSEQRGGAAVLLLDLDHFKAINDTLGHPVGDALLCDIADRLRRVAGDAPVARLGGDEFAALLDHADQAAAEALARRLIAAVEAPLSLDGHQAAVGTSIGMALFPTDGLDADVLMKNADLALYRAKDEGRGTFRFFEVGMDARAQARRMLEMDLRQALGRDELLLHFQPLFDLTHGQICAFEALLRWRHPTRGFVSPGEFIPLAEATGLIVPIGEWVINEACRQAQAWPSGIRVAVNVSTAQFRGGQLNSTIVRALATSGLAPGRLEIEITESLFLENSEATLSVLHSLRGLGVRIALDDFGTGYSSLSYLRSFPFDKIKIDRSFVTELRQSPSASAIVRAITDLARALGMETTAEGVEETAQVEVLRIHGCTNVQGFLFAQPVPAEAVPDLLQKHAAPATKVA